MKADDYIEKHQMQKITPSLVMPEGAPYKLDQEFEIEDQLEVYYSSDRSRCIVLCSARNKFVASTPGVAVTRGKIDESYPILS